MIAAIVFTSQTATKPSPGPSRIGPSKSSFVPGKPKPFRLGRHPTEGRVRLASTVRLRHAEEVSPLSERVTRESYDPREGGVSA
jgi:hypothetical protein